MPTKGLKLKSLDAELILPIATIRLARFDLRSPADYLVARKTHWLELCVTPRPLNSRGCFHEHWGPHRFEPIGDILLVPAGEELHIKGDSGGSQNSISCELHGSLVDEWLDTSIPWTEQRLQANLNISSLPVRQLLRRLADEARYPGMGGQLLAEFMVGQLIIELARYSEAVTDLPASGGLASWRLRLIDERMRDAGEPPTLTELATLCRVSVRQLTRGFRTSRSYSIGDYVVHSRIENAKRLLRSDERIKSIAHNLGFSSSSSFARAFQKATGLTPLQFRQRVMQPNSGAANPETPFD